MSSPLEPELPKGFSLQLNGGTQFAGFYIRFTKLSWRICLGWLAITVFFYDVEPILEWITSNVSNQALGNTEDLKSTENQS